MRAQPTSTWSCSCEYQQSHFFGATGKDRGRTRVISAPTPQSFSRVHSSTLSAKVGTNPNAPCGSLAHPHFNSNFLNHDLDLFMQMNSSQFSRAEAEVFLIRAVPRRVSRNGMGTVSAAEKEP